MQHIAIHMPHQTQPWRGGRVGSVALRRSYGIAAEFTGLEADTNRYDLLLHVKRAGRHAGFSPKMIQLLDYYMAFTRDVDWEEGARPIVYQSLARTALDLGVSERQIQRLEQGLFALGALTWNDSGNHKRYGQRCPQSGRILYAFGVDLTPLAELKAELAAKLAEKESHDKAWLETKRQISWCRRQICASLAEAEEGSCPTTLWASRYQAIAFPIRTYMDLPALQSLLAQHRALHNELLAALPQPARPTAITPVSDKTSSKDDLFVVHYNSTTRIESFDKSKVGRPEASCFRESVPASGRARPNSVEHGTPQGSEEGPPAEVSSACGETTPPSSGLERISVKQALNVASEHFRAHLPLANRPLAWADLVDAAYRLKGTMHVSQQSWAEACSILGRNGAAVCLLLTDRATQRPEDPVLKPGAYFRAMTQRAKTGQLHLHSSVLGILKREEGAPTTESP